MESNEEISPSHGGTHYDGIKDNRHAIRSQILQITLSAFKQEIKNLLADG